jgi:hypothetical protein
MMTKEQSATVVRQASTRRSLAAVFALVMLRRERSAVLLSVAVVVASVAAFALSGAPVASANGTPVTVTFPETGVPASWTVPAGVHSVRVRLYGANGAAGGSGARVSAAVAVTPGSTLGVVVGGAGNANAGGYNGGGSTTLDSTGGGGGGATDLLNSSSEPLLVAGGGGGGGGGVIGRGAGGNADHRGMSGMSVAAWGATFGRGRGGAAGDSGGAGGAAGPVSGADTCPGGLPNDGLPGGSGTAGQGGQGGLGGLGGGFGSNDGGGGGGGYVGGGGGGGAAADVLCGGVDPIAPIAGSGGGGGGSSHTAGLGVSHASVNDAPVAPTGLNGNGEAIITYTP